MNHLFWAACGVLALIVLLWVVFRRVDFSEQEEQEPRRPFSFMEWARARGIREIDVVVNGVRWQGPELDPVGAREYIHKVPTQDGFKLKASAPQAGGEPVHVVKGALFSLTRSNLFYEVDAAHYICRVLCRTPSGAWCYFYGSQHSDGAWRPLALEVIDVARAREAFAASPDEYMKYFPDFSAA